MRLTTRCLVIRAAALAVTAFLATPLWAACPHCKGKGGSVSTGVTVDGKLSNTHDPRIFGPHWKAQTFKLPTCATLTQITFSVRKRGSPPTLQNLVVGIYNVNDMTGAPEIPIGMGPTGPGAGGTASPLAEGEVDPTTVSWPDHGSSQDQCKGPGGLSEEHCYKDVAVLFTSPVTLSCGSYAAVFHQKNGGGDGNNSYELGLASGNPYPDGQFWENAGGRWFSHGPEKAWDVRMSVKFTCAGCPGGDPGDCTAGVGSLCCALTQGAYGAPNSQATALGNNDCCNPIDMGDVPLAACQSNNVFGGDPNRTTIGIHGNRAVTIGPPTGGTPSSLDLSSCTTPGTMIKISNPGVTTFNDDLLTLNNYLPATGTPGAFNGSLVGPDTHYCGSLGCSAIPDASTSGGNSGGQGGGTLSGQAMTTSLNMYMSGVAGMFSASGYAGFTVPGPPGTLFCTKRSGEDKVLGNSDDVCEAFQYPSGVVGQTVAAVLAAANTQLATGGNSLGTASELNNTLNNFNVQFDSCGVVVACPVGVQPGPYGPGTAQSSFTCP